MPSNFQFLLYQSADENISVNAVIKDETIWLTQKAMAELFGCSTDNISLHLKNIFADGELSEQATTEDFSVVQTEGTRSVSRRMRFYNLDAIISVGYRVNSRRATQFRIWATGVLKEYITKGFVLDDERLKQGKTAFGKDYFRELLERVRSIRASERRIWQQVTDIFAECSIDYDKNAAITHEFYAMVQNKFHYAITGQTAAEIIIAGPTTPGTTWACKPGRTPGWPHLEVRCRRGQKLSGRQTDPPAGTRGDRIFRLYRGPDRAGEYFHNGGICGQHQRVPLFPPV